MESEVYLTRLQIIRLLQAVFTTISQSISTAIGGAPDHVTDETILSEIFKQGSNPATIMRNEVARNIYEQARSIKLINNPAVFDDFVSEITTKLVWAFEMPQTDIGLIVSQAIGQPVTQASLSKDPNSRRKMTDITMELRELISAQKKRHEYAATVFFKGHLSFHAVLNQVRTMLGINFTQLMRHDSPEMILVSNHDRLTPWQQTQMAIHGANNVPVVTNGQSYYKWRLSFLPEQLVYYNVSMMDLVKVLESFNLVKGDLLEHQPFLVMPSPQKIGIIEILPHRAYQQNERLMILALERARLAFSKEFRGVANMKDATVMEKDILSFVTGERLAVMAELHQVAFPTGQNESYLVVADDQHFSLLVAGIQGSYYEFDTEKKTYKVSTAQSQNAVFSTVSPPINIAHWLHWPANMHLIYFSHIPPAFKHKVTYHLQGNQDAYPDSQDIWENLYQGTSDTKKHLVEYQLQENNIKGNCWAIDWAQTLSNQFGPNLFGRFLNLAANFSYMGVNQDWELVAQANGKRRRPMVVTVLQTMTQTSFGPVSTYQAPKKFITIQYNNLKEQYTLAIRQNQENNLTTSGSHYDLLWQSRVAYAICRDPNPDASVFWSYSETKSSLLGNPAVDHLRTYSSSFDERTAILGIEASRLLVIMEFSFLMDEIKQSIHHRYLMLMGDVMSQTGAVFGLQSTVTKGAGWHAPATQANGYGSIKQRAVYGATSHTCRTLTQGPHNNTAAFMGTLIMSGTGQGIDIQRVGYDPERDKYRFENLTRQQVLNAMIGTEGNMKPAARETPHIQPLTSMSYAPNILTPMQVDVSGPVNDTGLAYYQFTQQLPPKKIVPLLVSEFQNLTSRNTQVIGHVTPDIRLPQSEPPPSPETKSYIPDSPSYLPQSQSLQSDEQALAAANLIKEMDLDVGLFPK